MTEEQHKKTRIFTVIVVLSNVLGNSFLSRGMRGVGELLSLSPLPYIQALFNPWVALGASLLVLWLLSHMALLSWADLSYVLPVTAIGYVLVALTARVFLHEHVSPWRWAGIGLIVAGVMLVSRTAAITTAKPSGDAA
ncbi:MAG: EamA family transporter [Candidatus Solibacter usitatus]|nr:EamA family transporter [Candidatus Solibacter usitatus]